MVEHVDTHKPPHGSLEISHVSKSFGEKKILEDINFTVNAGVLTGFLGANGSGKTTTMRIIMGLLEPCQGEILYCGEKITSQHRKTFGYMPEERGLYPKQPLLSQLVYLGQLHGMDVSTAKSEATDYLEFMGLGEHLNSKLESLSLGNQQRVQIIASILHRPKALILDEPFSGLDPQGIENMVQLLYKIARSGVPVMFSSHQLDLIDRLCEEVVILHQGIICAAGNAQQLREESPQHFRMQSTTDLGWLRSYEGIRVLDFQGTQALLEFVHPIEQVRPELLRYAVDQGMTEFSRVLPTLGDIYRGVTAQ
ncbi:ABC transporter ATP-binding protein [Rothia sp. P6271]|uniref:ABC transporter ATP-binding protein n=1 Tax=Rothia sp. P6271 TaxID=3402659 RepID=UPI003AC436D3